jgi:hypothetical protein
MNNVSDKLLINLKIISKIQKNGRISRSNDGIILLETSSFYKSLKRFISSDSRKQSLFEINSVILECIEVLHNLLNSKYMHYQRHQTRSEQLKRNPEFIKSIDNVKLIITELENAKIGVENLKFTYRNDQNTVSQLDIILMKISTTLQDTNSCLDAMNIKIYYEPDNKEMIINME